ncbi:50S ribosomal protein L29 [Caloramator mitchellensis]|uniref:Large ribosomal subunit protein uL29 n=1 Tax=Caloramator mitchellensis TaxID=908809 RepID=A0A0R3JUP1_CALMK|nr:50S ribosomal protein L29 [Caloramator mitchellensis]KRQ87291.1 50S ribosomal protein L29 [Caloramator mitchellensis]
MKANELKVMRESTPDELLKRITELKAELFNLRFQHATGQLENPMRIREVKKTIAQLKTIMRENELKAMGR